jgi:iron complex transport system substrate-binding protein
MLGENTLVGFPNTDYISSEKRKRIDAGKIRSWKNENPDC